MVIDRKENIGKLLEFLFKRKTELTEIQLSENISIFDLSSLIGKSTDLNKLENDYQKWIKISGRNNTMDEYGTLLGLIGFLERNSGKKQLILRVENKILCPTTYKNNGGISANTKDNNNNKLWSKLKSLWS